MPTFFSIKKTEQIISTARYSDSATGDEIDEAAILVVSAYKKSARLAHRGSIFFMDCRSSLIDNKKMSGFDLSS